jgi:hypothetical protein
MLDLLDLCVVRRVSVVSLSLWMKTATPPRRNVAQRKVIIETAGFASGME